MQHNPEVDKQQIFLGYTEMKKRKTHIYTTERFLPKLKQNSDMISFRYLNEYASIDSFYVNLLHVLITYKKDKWT